MKPITFIETPFHEKFGIPRQPLIVMEACGKLRFPKNDFFMEAFRGIEASTHLWLIFEFHKIPDEHFNGLVRPPRFEGKMKLGVYATRSPHRPNRLGLSVVKFDRLEIFSNEVVLWVKGVDLLDGTPIFDIKPYVPYSDSIPQALSSNFAETPLFKEVIWLSEHELSSEIKLLIEKVVSLDPRPGHEKDQASVYGVSLAGWNIRFREKNGKFEIFELTKIRP